MFHPLSVYVGLRYVRARSHTFFVSFITWASLLGVCVGVAALIVILSVMNGFESELRERLLSLNAPVRISAPAAQSRARTGMRRSAPSRARAACAMRRRYAELQALAVRQPEMVPVLLRGIDPAAAASRADLGRSLTQGHLADLTPGSARVILGAIIAERLGLSAGDLDHRAAADRERRRRADPEAARVHAWPGSSRSGCRTMTARWCSRNLRGRARPGRRLGERGAAGARGRTCSPRRRSPRACVALCRRGSR